MNDFKVQLNKIKCSRMHGDIIIYKKDANIKLVTAFIFLYYTFVIAPDTK